MNKLDLKKLYKEAYTAGKEPRLISVPPIQFITLEGQGDPNTAQSFQNAFGVLYGLAYTLKFMLKERGEDFTVMPVEGQWWGHHVERDFKENDKNAWLWKVMIALPDSVTPRDLDAAREGLKQRKDPPDLEKAKLERIEDGLAVQILHIGSYSEEEPTIEKMHNFAFQQGYRLRGRHREIYLSNPQRTAPEKLKTILRHPVEKA